jgi:hypothetical protein
MTYAIFSEAMETIGIMVAIVAGCIMASHFWGSWAKASRSMVIRRRYFLGTLFIALVVLSFSAAILNHITPEQDAWLSEHAGWLQYEGPDWLVHAPRAVFVAISVCLGIALSILIISIGKYGKRI